MDDNEFPQGCTWLVQVPSGHPEPDFPSDCWLEVPCGAPVKTNPFGSFACEGGHRHVSFADPTRGEFELELLAEEEKADQFRAATNHRGLP